MGLRLLSLRAPRHVLFGAASLAAGAVIAATLPPRDPITAASWATAYVSLAWLAATLAVGPLRILAGRPSPISTNLRRDLGIWAGVLGVAHAGVGLCVHLRGRPWLYFVDERARPRFTLWGLANDTGLLAALILALLTALSNDAALRALGARRWKSIQRWSYAAAALTAVHAFAYQATERRTAALVVTVAIAFAAVLALQVAGVRRFRRG